MKLTTYIKSIFLSLLTFLLGTQTTYAKTKVIPPQNKVVILVEQNQSFKSLEKVVPPNIGILKEKAKFVVVQGVSAQNCFNFSEGVVGGLANAGGSWLTKLDDLFAKPHFNQFQVKLIDFSSWGATSTSQRLAKYGTPTALKNRIKTLLESPSVNNIKSADEIINYIDDFMLKYANKPPDFGALAYFDELVMTTSKFKGGAYGLEILNNLPPSLNGKTLTKFEASIDDLTDATSGCRFDLQFSDGAQLIFVETKNYAKTTSFSSSFYNQFKAYISNPNLTSLDQIKYFFRANTGITKAERIQKFKNLINNGNNKMDFFNSLNPSLKNQFQIEVVSDIDDAFLNAFFNTIIEVY